MVLAGMWSIEHEGRDQRLLYKSSQETMVPLTQVVAVVVVRVRFCTSFKGGFLLAQKECGDSWRGFEQGQEGNSDQVRHGRNERKGIQASDPC